MWRILIAVGLASLLVDQRVIAQENRDEHSIVFRLAPLDEKREPPVVTAMALSPDHIHLAVAGDDHAIRIVRLDTQKSLQRSSVTRTGSSHWTIQRTVDGLPRAAMIAVFAFGKSTLAIGDVCLPRRSTH